MVSALDDVAWVCNMRGSDVQYNPVFFSFLLLTPTTATLYLRLQQQSPEVQQHAQEQGLLLKEYGDVHDDIRALAAQGKVFTVDANRWGWGGWGVGFGV